MDSLKAGLESTGVLESDGGEILEGIWSLGTPFGFLCSEGPSKYVDQQSKVKIKKVSTFACRRVDADEDRGRNLSIWIGRWWRETGSRFFFHFLELWR